MNLTKLEYEIKYQILDFYVVIMQHVHVRYGTRYGLKRKTTQKKKLFK